MKRFYKYFVLLLAKKVYTVELPNKARSLSAGKSCGLVPENYMTISEKAKDSITDAAVEYSDSSHVVQE